MMNLYKMDNGDVIVVGDRDKAAFESYLNSVHCVECRYGDNLGLSFATKSVWDLLKQC